MKSTTTVVSAIAAAILTFGTCTCEADADIVISDFFLTENSLSFIISGTFPSLLPVDNLNALLFVNPDVTADPGFALGNFLSAATFSFSGTQPLRDDEPVATGTPSFGDYFFVAFENDFTDGEAILGSLTATWSTTAFDPSQLSMLDVYWGNDDNNGVVGTGIYLTSVTVPEPSSLCIVALLGSAIMVRRHARKSNTTDQSTHRA